MKVKRKMTTESTQPVAPAQTQPDPAFTKAAEARLMVEQERRAREMRCGQEIDGAIQAISKRHNCTMKFMELREGGQTMRIWLQPVAQDEPTTQ